MKCFIIIFFVLFFNEANGQKSNGAYKTFVDTIFETGDRIITPEISFGMSGHLQNYSKFSDSTQVIHDFLIQHPNIRIEIGVHTDQRGSTNGNLVISEKRASAIKVELIKLYNINPDRINYKGYGESELLIKDRTINQAKTKSEKEKLYQLNRRTELTILD